MTAPTLPRIAWMDRAACVDCPSEWWDLAGDGAKFTVDNEIAIKICRGCPVTVECWATWGAERGIIVAGRRGGSRPRPPTPPEQATPDQAKPAPPAARRDCTAPDYGSHKRHFMGGQEPCAACKAFVAAADRDYRARRAAAKHAPDLTEEI